MLAGLVLMDDMERELPAVGVLNSCRGVDENLVTRKLAILKANGRGSIRSLWIK